MNDQIYALSDEPFLKQQLKIKDQNSQAYRQMQDAEYVLRFLALNSNLKEFRGSLSREMDSFMIRHLHVSELEAATIGETFKESLTRCQSLWGDKAFRRPDGGSWRDQTLAGMYDAQMLSASRITQAELETALDNKETIIQMTRELFNDPEFDEAVRVGTNTPTRIHYRVQRMMDTLLQ